MALKTLVKKLLKKIKIKRPPVIRNPKVHLSKHYGKGWTFESLNRVHGYRCLNMSTFPGKNHCSLTAVTAISRFYRDQGFVAFPSSDRSIYDYVHSFAQKRKFYFKRIGTFSFFIGSIVKGLWNKVGYHVNVKNHPLLLSEQKIQELLMGEVDAQRPCIVSFSGGQYRRHSLVLYGYLIYKRDGEEKIYYIVNDLWARRPRFVDGTSLANPLVTMVQVLQIWP